MSNPLYVRITLHGGRSFLLAGVTVAELEQLLAMHETREGVWSTVTGRRADVVHIHGSAIALIETNARPMILLNGEEPGE
ncbi:MAG: hypothetical protein HOQ43_10845 [Glycomyces artemisiae]|uniref:Uncharacterized protein n=1 Tax=Glycomyces artemisiae TaxID=1076443 RepID=A0A850C9M6_9ACTN|nr:hypothetical protein [Glycomyces artemisiae]